MTRASAQSEVVRVARTMLAEGLVVGTLGNVSVRFEDEVIITPSRFPYEGMTADGLVAVDLGDGAWSGSKNAPSSELALHLAVYRRCATVRALVHTHSPYASAWSYLGEPLEPTTAENEYYRMGTVPTCGGSSAAPLVDEAARSMGRSSAILLARHGVLAAGADAAGALEIAEVVERQAQIAWILRGQPHGSPASGQVAASRRGPHQGSG